MVDRVWLLSMLAPLLAGCSLARMATRPLTDAAREAAQVLAPMADRLADVAEGAAAPSVPYADVLMVGGTAVVAALLARRRGRDPS